MGWAGQAGLFGEAEPPWPVIPTAHALTQDRCGWEMALLSPTAIRGHSYHAQRHCLHSLALLNTSFLIYLFIYLYYSNT